METVKFGADPKKIRVSIVFKKNKYTACVSWRKSPQISHSHILCKVCSSDSDPSIAVRNAMFKAEIDGIKVDLDLKNDCICFKCKRILRRKIPKKF